MPARSPKYYRSAKSADDDPDVDYTPFTPLWRIWDQKAQKDGDRKTVYWVVGETYKGQWKDNRKHGKGTYNYKSGNMYEGEWRNGRREGNGTLWVPFGGTYRVEYSGVWRMGKKDGFGILYSEYGERYEGQFKGGLRHGKGRQTYLGPGRGPDGSVDVHVYEGSWKNGKRDGHGIVVMANGDTYEGSWVNDLKEGPGVFYYVRKGTKYDGVWERDVPKCGTYDRYSNLDAIPKIPIIELQDAQQVLSTAVNQVLNRIKFPMASAENNQGDTAKFSKDENTDNETLIATTNNNNHDDGNHNDGSNTNENTDTNNKSNANSADIPNNNDHDNINSKKENKRNKSSPEPPPA